VVCVAVESVLRPGRYREGHSIVMPFMVLRLTVSTTLPRTHRYLCEVMWRCERLRRRGTGLITSERSAAADDSRRVRGM
jgi:hypothetical protein